MIMKIGIGLPGTVPGTEGRLIVDWARRAEQQGFATLGVIDRIVYPNYDTLIVLAAAGAVTERIELMPNVLLGPTRNPVLLAKETASVDQLSGGRLTLGVGVGGREDDFTAAGLNFHDRGRRWDAALEVLHQAWAGEPVAGGDKAIGPRPVRGKIPLVFGGSSDEALTRTVRWGEGWTAGGGGPAMSAPFIARLRDAWHAAGREGAPRLVGLAYYALGDEAAAQGANYLRNYYGAAPWVEGLLQSLLRTPEAVQS